MFFSKQDYYPALWSIYSSVPRDSTFAPLHTITVRMQRKIFLSSGSSLSSLVTPDDVTYDGTASFPFSDVGAGYQCSPCKLIDISGGENGVTLRLSWSGSIPLALWAGDTQSWDGPYVHAIGRAGASDLVESTASRIDAVLVGLDPSVRLTLTEPIAFTLSVEKP